MSYFDADYFDSSYFDADGVLPKPDYHHGGGRQRWRKVEEVMRDWRIEQDDEELLFWE